MEANIRSLESKLERTSDLQTEQPLEVSEQPDAHLVRFNESTFPGNRKWIPYHRPPNNHRPPQISYLPVL